MSCTELTEEFSFIKAIGTNSYKVIIIKSKTMRSNALILITASVKKSGPTDLLSSSVKMFLDIVIIINL